MEIQEFGNIIKTIVDKSSFSKTKSELSLLETMSKKLESVKVGFQTTQDTDKIFKSMKTALAEIEKQRADIMHNPKLFTGTASEQQKLLNQMEKLDTIAKRIKDVLKGGSDAMFVMGESAAKVGDTFNKIKTTNIGAGMKEATKHTLKWIAALVGARSAYTFIRKAMSTYLSQNEELYYKLQACYYALGSLFAPVLEFILNLFVKLVGYVNLFAKALGFAGISMKSTAKSAGKTAKMLAPFDEINNINNETGGGAGGSNPLADFTPNENWTKAIEAFAALMKEKWKEILALILGVATALKLIFKYGEDAFAASGWGIMTASVLLFFADLLTFVKDPSWTTFLTLLLDLGVAIAGFLVGVGAIPGAWGLVVALVGAAILWFREDIAEFLVWFGNAVVEFYQNELCPFLKGAVNVVLSIFKTAFGSIADIWIGFVNAGLSLFTGLWEGIKLIGQGIVQIFKGDVINGLRTAFQGIVTVAKGVLNAGIDIVNGFLQAISRGINMLIDGINSLGFTVPSWIPSWLGGGQSWHPSISHINWGNIPHLDVGTNYVPNDMLAMLHQGEAVVPKKFNEDHSDNSEETNELLRQLIEVVDSKEFKAYISQREVGEASVKYINQQSRILGESVI